MHIYTSGAGSPVLDGEDKAVLIVFIILIIAVGGTAYYMVGHNLDPGRTITEDASHTNGDITVSVVHAELGFRDTRVDIKIENEGGSIMLFDMTRAQLVQDDRQYAAKVVENTPGVIYGGTTKMQIVFYPVEKDDFMFRLVLANDEGKLIPFEIDVGVG